MYLFKKLDGSIVDAPKNFNPDNPDLTMLEDVLEVLVIGSVLVKQVRLVKKPKEVRDAIRASEVEKSTKVSNEANKTKSSKKK